MSVPAPKLLVVEGKHEQYTLPWLFEAHGVAWPKHPPVTLEDADGIGNILKAGYIEGKLKESNREALGVIVDADDRPKDRWRALKTRYAPFATLPVDPPQGGFHQTLTVAGRPIEFGVWMMPDNASAGMFEDLLLPIVHPGAQPLHQLVRRFVDWSKAAGAGYKESHHSKALLASWLAIEEPGNPAWTTQFIKKLALTDSSLKPLADWFKAVFL